jgi:hypothetical protein
METADPLTQLLVAHLAKCREERERLETAYGNAVKGTVRVAQRALRKKQREVLVTRELLYQMTGRHHF